MSWRPYHEAIKALEHVYLEDSYVSDIAEVGDKLVFNLSAVLTESHWHYQKPKLGERYCYSAGSLCFSNIATIEWSRKTLDAARSVDPDGTVDFGEIDSFLVCDDRYHLEGSWGCVHITCKQVDFFLTPTE
ncbi:hypothetical protein [Asticcacaulis machinosus]|uniref:Uncharacterized protein n=1 Tax=Asticcacaulis machinosus TaxID=2984211 RepID=A0ABT5HEF2_9CAUL|nr:hypothetical protein [Asticcacaulis machinosus]MDC7674568.1 hypothetical protein [Asticcacaulis machinosus]